eukprot:m51a1_g11170 hypothetical protein (387) ;mRNA; r:304874-306034
MSSDPHLPTVTWYEDTQRARDAGRPSSSVPSAGARTSLLELLNNIADRHRPTAAQARIPKVQPLVTIGIEMSLSEGVSAVSPARIAAYETPTPAKLAALPRELLCARHPFEALGSLEAQQQALLLVIGDDRLRAAASGDRLPVVVANGMLRALFQHVAFGNHSVTAFPPGALDVLVVRDEVHGCVFLHDVTRADDETGDQGVGHVYEAACTTADAIRAMSPGSATAAYSVGRVDLGDAVVFVRSELDGTAGEQPARPEGEPREETLDGGVRLRVWAEGAAAPEPADLLEVKTCKWPLNPCKAFDVAMQMSFAGVERLVVCNRADRELGCHEETLAQVSDRIKEKGGQGLGGVVAAVSCLLASVAADRTLDGRVVQAEAAPKNPRRY